MSRISILDATPAGLACKEPEDDEAGLFRAWMYKELFAGNLVVIPEIADYEVRRSLILNGASKFIQRLDELYIWSKDIPSITYLPINARSMRIAAELWAQARREHRPTADDKALDGDVILAAQSQEFCRDSDDWQILTANVAHITRYVGDRARLYWAVVNEWRR